MKTPKKKRQSQNEKIIAYLQTGGRVSAMDAMAWFGCTRLAARIQELRKDGWPIKSIWCDVEGTRFVSYRLPMGGVCNE